MNFYAACALINSAIILLLFFTLLIKKQKPRAANFFNLFNISTLIWAISYYFWQTSHSYNEAMFWIKMLMVGAILMAPTFFHFATVVVEKEKKFLWLIVSSYLAAIVFIFLNFFSKKFIVDLQTKISIPYFPTGGLYFFYFLAPWVILILFAFYNLYVRSKETVGSEKEFIDVILYSTFISFTSGSVNYFLWFNIPIPPVTNLVVGAYAIAITVLLLQGKFYKINLYYFEYFAAIAILASLLQFVLKNELSQQLISTLVLSIIMLATYFLIRTSNNEKRGLEKIYSLNKLLSESLNNMINSIDAAVIIVNKNSEIVTVNQFALDFFNFQKDSYPKRYFDFVRGNTNKALEYSLEDYLDSGRTVLSTTMLTPTIRNIDMFFSPFTHKEPEDCIMIMIKNKNKD